MLGALELGKDLVHAVNVNSRQLEHNADVLPLHPARLQILVFEANLVAVSLAVPRSRDAKCPVDLPIGSRHYDTPESTAATANYT